jgi:hypothetical protein
MLWDVTKCNDLLVAQHNGIVIDVMVIHKYLSILVGNDNFFANRRLRQARFQGSRYNRKNGRTSTDGSTYLHKPSSGAFKAISWRFAYPSCAFCISIAHLSLD